MANLFFFFTLRMLSLREYLKDYRAYQGVRNVSFSENFPYVPIEWSLIQFGMKFAKVK